MPITSIDVRDGDPTVQASGQHRGTVAATFSDGRIVERSVRAKDADEWNDKIAAISDLIQAQQEASDAQSAVDPETPVTAHKEASQAQTCIAYIREALATEQAYDAFLLLDRINTYVVANAGWPTVKPILLAAGLDEEEYDKAGNAFNYLSSAGRPAIMSDAKTIQANWEAQ